MHRTPGRKTDCGGAAFGVKEETRDAWEYTLGGYQVIKKSLSYRDHKSFGRPLLVDEARFLTEMARRIAAIVFLGQRST